MRKNIFYFSIILLLSACGSSSSPDDKPDTEIVNGNCNPSAEMLALLKAHNKARATARSCGTQSMPAVAKLAYNCILEKASFNHSKDMATVGFFSHTGSDGLQANDRISNLGYSYRAMGENIAAGHRTVDVVMQGWLNSPGHCRNMMNGIFTEMGAAKFERYWTVDFGKPR